MQGIAEFTSDLIYKAVFFFQGILSGLCLLQVLVLNLTGTTEFSQQIFRIDQCIRIASFVSAFGSFYMFLSSRRKCTFPSNPQIRTYRPKPPPPNSTSSASST